MSKVHADSAESIIGQLYLRIHESLTFTTMAAARSPCRQMDLSCVAESQNPDILGIAAQIRPRAGDWM